MALILKLPSAAERAALKRTEEDTDTNVEIWFVFEPATDE
jgi:hypothetical protein